MGEATGSSKVAKGSAIILIGNVIFRVGGYLYRFLMASLLGPAAYGILGLTTPFQGIFQVLSAAGLPPAIAKYVSEYNALDEEDLARQTVFTALKIMVFLGFFFGLIMVFVAAPIITNYYHKPEALLPLQAVGLITPFSVIVGAFRGAFQGVYKMEYILYTRAIEQIFMILFATALVILGLSTFGAVLGSIWENISHLQILTSSSPSDRKWALQRDFFSSQSQLQSLHLQKWAFTVFVPCLWEDS